MEEWFSWIIIRIYEFQMHFKNNQKFKSISSIEFFFLNLKIPNAIFFLRRGDMRRLFNSALLIKYRNIFHQSILLVSNFYWKFIIHGGEGDESSQNKKIIVKMYAFGVLNRANWVIRRIGKQISMWPLCVGRRSIHPWSRLLHLASYRNGKDRSISLYSDGI